MSTDLGVPTVQQAGEDAVSEGANGIEFSKQGHYFKTTMTDAELARSAEIVDRPLSVIYQVTRRCNFDCDFCSEIMQTKDPTLDQIASIQRNLAGVPRVFLSGGEPLLRRDFVEIVDIFHDHIVAVPTNATRGHFMAPKLVGKVSFINVGLEGPRNTTNRVRGDYDKVMRGIIAFKEAGLPLSISTVVLRSLLDALPFTYQIADLLGAGKIKLIHPIRKGNGLHLADSEFLTLHESAALFERMQELANEHGWTPGLRMTTWTPATEGYSILSWSTLTALLGHGRCTAAWPSWASRVDRRTRWHTWATCRRSQLLRYGSATRSRLIICASTLAKASPSVRIEAE